ncbi:MAG TPA: peptidylprolyl isomerase [Chryseosolibacter sp.]|nr:peptidylprolyl isomerase [Chryseosolibacter sp.]
MKKVKFALISVGICAFLVTGCAQKKDQIVTIKTKYGEMVAILYDETPKHKENFIKLAREHYYDSLLFHRVIEGFMIQGGDPDSRKAEKSQRLGEGGPGYTIPAEFNPKFFHEKGALAAARLDDRRNPDKASSGSQFYIVQGTKYPESHIKVDQQKFGSALQKFFSMPANKAYFDTLNTYFRAGDEGASDAYLDKLKPVVEQQLGITVERSPASVKAYSTVGGAPHLDGQYTVFGKVIKGLEVVDKIAAEPKDEQSRPLEDIRMQVTVEEMTRRKIEKLYGYVFPEE